MTTPVDLDAIQARWDSPEWTDTPRLRIAAEDIYRLLAIARAAEQLVPVLISDNEFYHGTTAYELLMALQAALKGAPSAPPR